MESGGEHIRTRELLVRGWEHLRCFMAWKKNSWLGLKRVDVQVEPLQCYIGSAVGRIKAL